MNQAKLDTLCNYFDRNADKPLALVLWELMMQGYTMYQIRKAYYHWLEEK